jgi:hypothetical protein
MAYYVRKNFGQAPDGRCGPNKKGGLPTKYSPDLCFNSDEPDKVYNIPFMIGKPQSLPDGYKPGQIAQWVWDSSKGPAPWPGSDPDPRNAPVTPPIQMTPPMPPPGMPTAPDPPKSVPNQ